MRLSLAVFVAALAVTPLAAQFSNVYIPDNAPSVGTCNVIPFGQSSTFSAGYSYIGRIPASFLDPLNPSVLDISFTPCGSGSWSANDVTIAMGHVPNPQPCPFQFPSGAGIGSFLDLTIIHDSSTMGPFTWNVTQDNWSPMGFQSSGGTGFTWNLIDDVAFFVTYSTSTVTWNGAFHRTGTEPARSYSAGYQAASSTACLSAAGLKMCLTVGPGSTGPEYQVNQVTASADVNGVNGNSSVPATVTIGVNTPAAITLTSSLTGASWDVAYGLAPLVPASGGGITLADGQIINVDVTDPTLGFLYTPIFAGPGFINTVIGVSIPNPVELSFQLAILDAGTLSGLSLSQPNRLIVQ